MIKLKATITPDKCPDLQKPLYVVNKRAVPIQGGTMTFYVTPQMVIAVKKIVQLKEWHNFARTYMITTHEIMTPIEHILE